MTIIRSPRPDTGWTVLGNDVLRDARLSYRARGVLASILSRPDNWRTTADALSREGREGREAIRTALLELVEFGYMARSKERTPDGRIRTVTVVFDTPTGNGLPGAGLPDAGSSGAFIKTESKDLQEERYSPNGFDEFWSAFPRKAGKRAAAAAWARAIKRATPHQIIEAAVAYANDPNRDPQFTAHPSTWLNRDGWDDEPLPGKRGSATGAYLEAAELFAAYTSDPKSLEA